jgi:hypothetical protein
MSTADNATFMPNLYAAALGTNGRVNFDHKHQGSTDLYEAKSL